MRQAGIWLLVLLMAGCASSKPSDNGPEALCRREAYNDPTVKRLTLQGMGTSTMNPKWQFDYDKALRDATNACLSQHGVAVRGGVEPVRPSY